MPLPAGILRETVMIEQESETRNDLGEPVATWTTFATRRANVEAISYSEQERQKQIGGVGSFVVRCRYVSGLTGKMRIRWVSRGNRILYIGSVVERNNREEHELLCSERAT